MEIEIINEYLEDQLRKIDLEVFHYENALKHDQERLSYFTNIKQHLESCIKNRQELVNNIKEGLENGIPLSPEIVEKDSLEITIDNLYIN